MIGNPPFLRGKLRVRGLGDDYVARMFSAWEGRVPPEADLVCYWFVKAAEQIEAGRAQRVGLVATDTIRGGAIRPALQAAANGQRIYDARSDESSVIDGVAVRVSLVCFSSADPEHTPSVRVDGQTVDEIHTDLTATRGGTGIDLTVATPLSANLGTAFVGDTKGGPFDIPGNLAREWLRLPANPNRRPNADVLKPWMTGMDLTPRLAGKWVVDFGWGMSEKEATLYEKSFRSAKRTASRR